MPDIATTLTVLVDASAIPADRGGVGRYVENVVPRLARPGVAVVVACQPRDRADFERWGDARVVEVPARAHSTAGRLVWEQFGLPALAKQLGADVIHSPHYTFPLLTRRKRVVTVHDLTFFTDPAVHSRLKAVFFRSWIRAAKAVRATIVTPSRATAAEYVRITRAATGRVFAAQLGYDASVFHEPTRAEVAGFAASLHPTPTAGWVAFLGTLEPRKNVSALVRGYRAATESLAPAQRPALLLAGGPGWDASVAETVDDARDDGFDVRMLGYLPLERLRALLGGSLLTAYPSLGEGFGLPVLEAMACGSAVLTTRRLSLPEVGGDAVAYCDVDPGSIATAIGALLHDSGERARLGAAATERALTFSWEACADRHVEAYRFADRRTPSIRSRS